MKVLERGTMQVILSIDLGRYHLSVSHKHRYPTWDEVKRMRKKYLPADKFFAMIFPPTKHYVNCHPYCFHLWEVIDDMKCELWGEPAQIMNRHQLPVL